MEEKKLTDEMEDLLAEFDEMGFTPTTLCPNAEEYAKNYKQRLLDLFHRLQDENKDLKEMCSKSSYKDSWKNKFFKAQEEIERLTEENGYLKQCADTFLDDCKRERNQSVKDTADKILGDLRNIFIEQSSYGCDANQHIGYYDYQVKISLVIEQIEEYAKEKYGIEYGVEVE